MFQLAFIDVYSHGRVHHSIPIQNSICIIHRYIQNSLQKQRNEIFNASSLPFIYTAAICLRNIYFKNDDS